jgi:hypothetical protein
MSRGSCRTKCRDLQGLRPVSSCEMRGSPRPRIRRGAAGRGQLVPAILSASGLFATEFLHICRAHVRTDCHTYMSIGNTNWLTRSFQDCCIADGSRPPRLASAKVSLIQYLGAKARGTRCRQGRVDATFTPRGRLSVPDGLRQGGSAPLWSSSRVGNLKHLASPRADQHWSIRELSRLQYPAKLAVPPGPPPLSPPALARPSLRNPPRRLVDRGAIDKSAREQHPGAGQGLAL